MYGIFILDTLEASVPNLVGHQHHSCGQSYMSHSIYAIYNKQSIRHAPLNYKKDPTFNTLIGIISKIVYVFEK